MLIPAWGKQLFVGSDEKWQTPPGKIPYLLISEFQRRRMRDKKTFLNEQCKEIEKDNRMGETRDLF